VDLLPATVEYREDTEDDFVRLVLSDINVDALEFKLTPTYVVYMAIRYKLMHDFRPPHHANDHRQRAHVVGAFAAKVANMTYHTIQVLLLIICFTVHFHCSIFAFTQVGLVLARIIQRSVYFFIKILFKRLVD